MDTPVPIWAYATLLAALALVAVVPEAHAQQYRGVLVLDPIPARVEAGDRIELSGRLMTTSGHYVPGAAVYIKDDVFLGYDDVIAAVRTDGSGYFTTTWTAKLRPDGGAYDFYAVFEGSSQVGNDRSATQSVRVSSGSGTGSYKASTSLYMDWLPASAYAGDELVFTGRLTTGNSPLQNAMIGIYEDDPLQRDELLAAGRTDSGGYFSIPWDVKEALLEKDFDIYAEFPGSTSYAKSQTNRQEVTITKYGGSITLDKFPSSARIGDVVTFSGMLYIEGHNPEGAAVYIMDEDTLNPDDLLATAYVDADGRFSTTWFVERRDPTSTMEIYAVFEGSSNLGRLTTCDRGVTPFFGGLCNDTISFTVLDYIPTPPRPRGEGEYMELYYSMNRPQNPHVAIIPAPQAYEKVKHHIGAVKEGILMWKPLLEERFGGDWDVSFEMVGLGGDFRQRPDIIVNLVTHDQDTGCTDEYYGWARIWERPPTTINTVVCSTSQGYSRSNVEVAATAGHEFIHAMGLGHTFNKPGDFMCSVEDGIPTCADTIPRSKTPSVLNLEAVGHIYGSNGFSLPDNHIRYRDRFSLGGSTGSGMPDQVTAFWELTGGGAPTQLCNSIDDTYNIPVDSERIDVDYYLYYAPICAGTISFSLRTSDESQGFQVFILPPETDVETFMDGGEGEYYTCEEYGEIWHSKSNRCYIDPGAAIVIMNPEPRPITVSGRISN